MPANSSFVFDHVFSIVFFPHIIHQVLYCFHLNLLNFCFAMLQIMRGVMHDETNMSLSVPTLGEDREQSVMGESHADDSVHRSVLVYF